MLEKDVFLSGSFDSAIRILINGANPCFSDKINSQESHPNLKVESGQGEGFLFKPFHSHLLAASGWGCTNGFLLHSIQRPSILLSLVDACEVVHYSLLKVFCLPLNHLIGDSTTPRKFASGKTFKISNR